MGTAIVNTALPGIQTLIGNGLAGAGGSTGAAFVADVFHQRLDRVRFSVKARRIAFHDLHAVFIPSRFVLKMDRNEVTGLERIRAVPVFFISVKIGSTLPIWYFFAAR